MNGYDVQRVIGDGAFGTVYKCKDILSGEIVAVKKIKQKYSSWHEALALKEVAALRSLPKNEYLVRLKKLIMENNILYFVFEFAESNLIAVSAAPWQSLRAEIYIVQFVVSISIFD